MPDLTPLSPVPAVGTIQDPTGKAANEVLVWDGDSWEAVKLTDAMVDAAAAIARSKLNFGSGLVNADIAAAAAIVRSKLNFGSGLVNADIAAAAALAVSKLAAGSSSRQHIGMDAGVPTWMDGAAFLSNTTAVGTGAATVETNLQTVSIAANTLTVGDIVKITAAGTATDTGTPETHTIRLYFGATVLTSKTHTPTNGYDWMCQATLLVTGASAQRASGNIFSPSPGDCDYTTPAENINGSITVKTTGLTANAADEISSEMLVVEMYPA